MAQDRVTRDELRNIRVKQTRIFILNEPKQIPAARMQAFQLAREENMKFSIRTDFRSVAIAITREG